ncbi:hypothetical protein [Psychrobacter sp.]|uniref:hypothetical protein n=1 Tax=Psychrobacter sp. TaxID=56811 RepID=UPI003C765FFB|tara:strand:+ start:467 stop:1153 length:687 start_codon:yes stop_codon:yes gene_type:complete
MLDLFLNFFRALADAIPKLYELYRDNQQEEKIVELLESYFILGDLIYSAEELLLIVRNKDKVDLSGLSLPELKAELYRIESIVSLQKLRLKRLGNIYLTNPTLDLLDSNIQFELKKALGSKLKGGLHGLASNLVFHQYFDFSGSADEDERDWATRANSVATDFIIEITDSDKISINEQDEVLQKLKALREAYLDKMNAILDKKDKTILAKKAKELANKYIEERNEYLL